MKINSGLKKIKTKYIFLKKKFENNNLKNSIKKQNKKLN